MHNNEIYDGDFILKVEFDFMYMIRGTIPSQETYKKKLIVHRIVDTVDGDNININQYIQ